MKTKIDEYLQKFNNWWNNVSDNQKYIIKRCVEFAEQEAIKEVKVLLNNHRGKGLITCDKTCFCWDIEKLLSKEELKKEGR